MKINPATKAAACKALGSFAEKAVAMADVINKAEEDGAAAAALPTEMASSVTAMAADLAKEMGPLMPQASAADPAQPAAPADPEVEMTTEMTAAVEKDVAKMSTFADAVEKALQKSLTAANVAKVAKGLDDVAAFKKALGEMPVAKAGGPKKLAFSQWMKMQGSLLERFVSLVMEFLPMLSAADAMEPAPGSEPAPGGELDMAKTVDLAVAKSSANILAQVEQLLASRFEQRLGAVTDQLTAIAKSRDGGNALPAGQKPDADDKDDVVIPFTSLNEQMRAKGKLPKAS